MKNHKIRHLLHPQHITVFYDEENGFHCYFLSTSKKGKRKDAKDDKKDDGPPPTKRRKGRASNINESDQPSYVQKIDVRIIIPQDLKRFLMDDCDFVTRQKQLVPLPKTDELTVKAVTEKYLKFREENVEDSKNTGALVEVCNGINEYFNVMIGSQLLYKFERVQYSDLLKDFPNKPLCEIYGCEHLLRLFVKLSNVFGV